MSRGKSFIRLDKNGYWYCDFRIAGHRIRTGLRTTSQAEALERAEKIYAAHVAQMSPADQSNIDKLVEAINRLADAAERIEQHLADNNRRSK